MNLLFCVLTNELRQLALTKKNQKYLFIYLNNNKYRCGCICNRDTTSITDVTQWEQEIGNTRKFRKYLPHNSRTGRGEEKLLNPRTRNMSLVSRKFNLKEVLRLDKTSRTEQEHTKRSAAPNGSATRIGTENMKQIMPYKNRHPEP